MRKTYIKVLIGLLFATLFLFAGCNENTSVKTISHQSNNVVKKDKVKKQIQQVSNTIPTVNLDGVFKDTALVTPKGKYMILIFETTNGPYCKKLRLDIHNNKKLYNELKNEFSTYSLNALKNKRHKIEHEGKIMDVDTKTLIDIYNVTSVPTLIFTDKSGKSIFVVPGYMPAKQFLVTLDFVKSGLWLGKNRKNTDVYKALKKFYIKKGIIKDKK